MIIRKEKRFYKEVALMKGFKGFCMSGIDGSGADCGGAVSGSGIIGL